MKINRRGKDGVTVETHGFPILGVESRMCPVAMMHDNPQVKELIDIKVRYDSCGVPMFGKKVPAWAVDLNNIVASADREIEHGKNELLARI